MKGTHLETFNKSHYFQTLEDAPIYIGRFLFSTFSVYEKEGMLPIYSFVCAFLWTAH